MPKIKRHFVYEPDLLGERLVGITNGRLTILEAPNDAIDAMVEEHHYSHKATQNRFASFVVNDANGNVRGLLQLGYGIRPQIKPNLDADMTKLSNGMRSGRLDNYCEFDRMWLSDDLPKFSESQCIGMLLDYIRKRYPRIKFVITYADESAGNTGTIYKATNAIRLGSVPCDFYRLSSGERVHPVSMYHRHKTRAWKTLQTIYPGIEHITTGYRQFRFLYKL